MEEKFIIETYKNNNIVEKFEVFSTSVENIKNAARLYFGGTPDIDVLRCISADEYSMIFFFVR